MGKRVTNQTGNLFTWVLALSLAIGICTYKVYVSDYDYCQPQPQQVELVMSDQKNEGNDNISCYHYLAPELSHKPLKRTREYEAHIQAVHQSRIKESMETISERSASYPMTVFLRHASTILHSSEESSSDLIG